MTIGRYDDAYSDKSQMMQSLMNVMMMATLTTLVIKLMIFKTADYSYHKIADVSSFGRLTEVG